MPVNVGLIFFNGKALNLIGTPSLTTTRKPDPPAPSTPTRTLITFDLSIQIDRHSAAGTMAACRALEEVFAVGEGILRVEDETGYSREWMASPVSATPNKELTGTENLWRVELSASAAYQTGSVEHETASITPRGGTEIFLHHIRDASVTVGTERHTARHAARNLTTTTTALTARVFHADPTLPYAERMASLHAKVIEYQALNAADGLLKFMAEENIVQVQELRPVIDERKEVLDLILQCKSYHLPGAEKVEASYQKNNSLDVSTGESITTLRGTIQADDYDVAMARLNHIRTSKLSEHSRLTKFNHTLPCVMGADTTYQEEWTGSIEFDMEFRTADNKCEGFEIKISSDEESNGSYKRSYSGFVTASTLSAATTKARDLGKNKHPNWVRLSETSTEINAMGAGETCQRTFIRLDFAYDYELVPDYIRSEFTMTRSKVSFGDRTATISGSITTSTREIADDFQAKVIPLLIPESSGLTTAQLESRIIAFSCTEANQMQANAPSYSVSATFIRREISFGIRVWDRGGSVHTKYRKSDSINYLTMQCSTSISGTIWADTEAKAREEFQVLKNTLNLNITSEKTDVELEKAKGADSNFVEFTFSAEGTCSVSGVTGIDLLEAQWTLERKGQYNHNAIAEIPYRKPIAQTNVGWTTGEMRLSGSVRSVKLKTAIDYAHSKIALILGTAAYQTESPTESVSPTLLPMNGAEITGYTFSFNYSRTYTSGLEGLMNSSIVIG